MSRGSAPKVTAEAMLQRTGGKFKGDTRGNVATILAPSQNFHHFTPGVSPSIPETGGPRPH